VLLVVPYTAVAEIGKEHGTGLAQKKLVIDVSNPIARRDGEDFVKQVSAEGGAGLATQKALPGARSTLTSWPNWRIARVSRRRCRSPATTRMRWRWRQR